MIKHYNLMKNLPDASRGDIYYYNGNGKYLHLTNQNAASWDKDIVENDPEWWQVREEIKEPERLEVTGIDFLREPKKNMWAVEYKLIVHLNGGGTLFESHQEVLEKLQTMYTQEQLNEEIEKAFNAGRERIGGFWNEAIRNYTYPRLQDYLSSLKK